LPKKPTEAELRIIKEMFEASVDGRPYDNERWGNYYRPYGLEAPAGATTVSTSATTETRAPVTAPVAEPIHSDEPEAVSTPVVVPQAASSDKTQDILAMIRARKQNAGA
jgi:hypothetical protein